MDSRHVSYNSPVVEADQNQNENHFSAEHLYSHMGRISQGNGTSIQPGNSSSIHPVNISSIYPRAVTPRAPYVSRWDSETVHNHSSSIIGMELEVPHAYDPFPLPAPGDYPSSDNIHHHSNYYNTHGGLIDPATGTERGPLKRKNSRFSIACERGSTSGSSSSQQLEKTNLNHHVYPPAPISLPPNTGNNLSINTDDSQRNIRSRPWLNLEPNSSGNNLSTYYSHHYHPPTEMVNNHGSFHISHMNADTVAHDQNGVYSTSDPHGRFQISEGSGFSPETNQFFYDPGHYQRVPFTRRNHGPGQIRHAPSPHPSRGGRTNYSRRVMPAYRTGLNYTHQGHQVPISEYGSETFSSRNVRPSSSRGWHHSHRNEQSRTGIERFEAIPRMIDVPERMGSEALLMLDHSFNDSRNFLDQYRDLRLDIDDMSYEELLALGERIGHVSTGVSECMISKCLIECPSDENQEEAKCAICLEEYIKNKEIGTVKKCGHSYHVSCIKKWLSMKNACPICKEPAHSDDSEKELL